MDTQKYSANKIEDLCEHLETLNLEFMTLVKSELKTQSRLASQRGHSKKRTQRIFLRETFSSQVNTLLNLGKDIIKNTNTLLDAFKNDDFDSIEEYVDTLSKSRLRYQESGIATYDMLTMVHHQ